MSTGRHNQKLMTSPKVSSALSSAQQPEGLSLYDLELPEIKPTNAKVIIETCKKLHQDDIDRHTKNTQRRRWDKYWVAAYDMILTKL